MPVETPSFFARVIQEHLELKERNAELEPTMPLGRYKDEDPFENHPLFKTEEQARLEETMEVVAHADEPRLAWPGEEAAETEPQQVEEGLWSKSRDFDWGD
jgi:hypothetical protein